MLVARRYGTVVTFWSPELSKPNSPRCGERVFSATAAAIVIWPAVQQHETGNAPDLCPAGPPWECILQRVCTHAQRFIMALSVTDWKQQVKYILALPLHGILYCHLKWVISASTDLESSLRNVAKWESQAPSRVDGTFHIQFHGWSLKIWCSVNKPVTTGQTPHVRSPEEPDSWRQEVGGSARDWGGGGRVFV